MGSLSVQPRNIKKYPQITSDGASGAIITWQDTRTLQAYIYAQRVDAMGTPQWIEDGVAICTMPGNQQSPQLTSDGSGGAIIAWQGMVVNANTIYAQRVNANGVVQWAENGVRICETSSIGVPIQIAPDGAGGAIIAWDDWRNETDSNIYVQRVDSGGNIMWATNGICICAACGNQNNPRLILQGRGGAIVSWDDNRSCAGNGIYAQRINGNGETEWQPDGIPICTAEGNQWKSQIAAAGTDGAIITWIDYRNAENLDVYA